MELKCKNCPWLFNSSISGWCEAQSKVIEPDEEMCDPMTYFLSSSLDALPQLTEDEIRAMAWVTRFAARLKELSIGQ